MKILIEITHPAHVHFFRNAIKIFKEKEYELFITSREKEITCELLRKYGLEHKVISKPFNNKIGLAIELLIHEFQIFKILRTFKPNIIISIGGIFNVHAAWLCSIPTVVFTDTEHAQLSNNLTIPFCSYIYTPSCFLQDLGAKQVRYNSYHELAYLHPDYFVPDPSMLDLIGLNQNERFVIMRFVSWGASHDIGHKGLSIEMKRKAVKEILNYAKVFITSEKELPPDLKPYQIQIPLEKIHHILYYSTLYFGDGGTMASECAVLGTPAINVSTSASLIGVFADIKKYGLMHIIPDEEKALQKAIELLKNNNVEKEKRSRRSQLISDKIDVTKLIVTLVENYSKST